MSTYSPRLRIQLITTGDQAGAWGNTTNTNFEYIFDTAIAGYQAITITSTSQLLTSLNGPTSSAALNQSVYAFLKFNSASAATNIFAPPVSKQYIIWNNSGHAITIYNSAVINVIPSPITTTGVTIANNNKVMVWSDGTNFYDVQAQNLTGTLAIANGGTGQITANAAFNALAPSQTSANGKYLKSDGTNTAFDQIDISTGDITGTLPVANGGTGATTFTSGALLKGAGAGAIAVASAADIVGQIGATAVTNATNATTAASCSGNAATATTAGNVSGVVAIGNGGTGQTSAVNAGSALGAIGVGQTWQNPSRSAGVTYTNSTGRPIMVAISVVDGGPGSGSYSFVVSGVTVVSCGYDFGAFFSVIVPNGNTYILGLSNAGIGTWSELR